MPIWYLFPKLNRVLVSLRDSAPPRGKCPSAFPPRFQGTTAAKPYAVTCQAPGIPRWRGRRYRDCSEVTMARFLIAYGTTEGQTRKIVARIADRIRERDEDAILFDSSNRDEDAFAGDPDAVLVAGSVHQGKHQPALRQFVEDNRRNLDLRPNAFLSVSLAAAGDEAEDREEAERYMREFEDATGWKPQETLSLAGALLYTQYDFFKRFIMKLITRRKGGPTDTDADFEFTDWDAVDRFTDSFVDRVAARIRAQEKQHPPATAEGTEGRP